MNLVEKHVIKLSKRTSDLFETVDKYSYLSKNLYNSANYLINQCSLIHYKLMNGEPLDREQSKLVYDVNQGIKTYNQSLDHNMEYVTAEHCNVSNYNFLAWYLKTSKEFKETGSMIGQQCLRDVSQNWSSFFKSMKAYKNKKSAFKGIPRKPGYLDKETGRNWVTLTKGSFKLDNGYLTISKFPGLRVHTNKDVSSVSLKTNEDGILVRFNYQKTEKEHKQDNKRYYSIDIGVDNLMTITSNTEITPIIVNGRPLKSINQYYNKRVSELRSLCKVFNKRDTTNRISKMTTKRNNLIKNYLHKSSRNLINEALKNDISTIVIGKNTNWKQSCNLGKINNQTFIQIPFNDLIHTITYKAELEGIKVIETEEAYTSGTSYLDNEVPTKDFYDKSRRKHRGLFVSNSGESINADVNGSYQIMKKVFKDIPIKHNEIVKRVNI